MLTGKRLGLHETSLIKQENIEHHPLNALNNLNILSLALQLPNLGGAGLITRGGLMHKLHVLQNEAMYCIPKHSYLTIGHHSS